MIAKWRIIYRARKLLTSSTGVEFKCRQMVAIENCERRLKGNKDEGINRSNRNNSCSKQLPIPIVCRLSIAKISITCLQSQAISSCFTFQSYIFLLLSNAHHLTHLCAFEKNHNCIKGSFFSASWHGIHCWKRQPMRRNWQQPKDADPLKPNCTTP